MADAATSTILVADVFSSPSSPPLVFAFSSSFFVPPSSLFEAEGEEHGTMITGLTCLYRKNQAWVRYDCGYTRVHQGEEGGER